MSTMSYTRNTSDILNGIKLKINTEVMVKCFWSLLKHDVDDCRVKRAAIIHSAQNMNNKSYMFGQ